MGKEQSDLSMKARGRSRGIKRLVYGRTVLILLALLLQIGVILSLMLSLLEGVPALFGGIVAFTAVMLIIILNTRDNPSVKLSWCIVIAVLPVFGTVLYLFVRMELGHRAYSRLVQKALDESGGYIAGDPVLMAQIKEDDRQFYNLARYLEDHGFPVCDSTDAVYFPLGEDMFQRMLQELEKAEKFIFLEYFIIEPGQMWDRILEVLSRKARQGVEVRVMYDGSCAVSCLPYRYPRELEKLGIQCKMFSPFRPLVSTHYNNRDHRKILVIDGDVAFTGGINLADEYINARKKHGHWKDTAVMVRGKAAGGFTLMFLQMWNATQKEKVYEPYLCAGEEVGAQGCVIPYGDSPLDSEHVGQMVYLNILNQAKDYVYIMTPYLILDNETVTALQFAARRGVDVRLILPHIPDKKMVFAMAKSHYRELIEAGVKIYEYTPGFVHAKVFLSDDAHGVVGTINLDYRSLYLHFECAAYLYRVPALKDIRVDFEETMEKSRMVTMHDVKKRSLLSRFVGAVLKVAAPLM